MDKCIPCIRVGTNHIWEPDCELNWAELTFQGATLMLYPQETENPISKRDARLYFEIETIDGIAEKTGSFVKEVEETEMTLYGRKEIGFEDLNGYSITLSCLPNNSD